MAHIDIKRDRKGMIQAKIQAYGKRKQGAVNISDNILI